MNPGRFHGKYSNAATRSTRRGRNVDPAPRLSAGKTSKSNPSPGGTALPWAILTQRSSSLDLQHKGAQTPHLARPPERPLCLPPRHRSGRGIPNHRSRRYRRPPSPSSSTPRAMSPGPGNSKTQGWLLAMDGTGLRMAAGIRRVQRQSVTTGRCAALYPQSGGAPSEAQFRAGVPHSAAPLRPGIRSALRTGITEFPHQASPKRRYARSPTTAVCVLPSTSAPGASPIRTMPMITSTATPISSTRATIPRHA